MAAIEMRIFLIATEDVAGVDLILDVIKAGVVAVGDDGMRLFLECLKIVDDLAAEEGRAIGKSWLVDNDFSTLGLDALHDALDGRLAEVVGVGFHREAIDTDNACVGVIGTILVVACVVVPSCHLQHSIGNEVLACAVALHNGCHHLLRDILVIGKELLGVLGQAIASIAK